MEQRSRSKGGRPRGFDRAAALDIAMHMFWRHGYRGVSITDLTIAIGVAAPSLYAAFGSKAELYHEALDAYADRDPQVSAAAMEGAISLASAGRALLEAAIQSVTDPAGEPGCMISSGMIGAGADLDGLRENLIGRRKRLRADIEARARVYVDAGRARQVGFYLSAILQGLSIQAHDGATREDLAIIAGAANVALEALELENDLIA